jgi:hypothetical protein
MQLGSPAGGPERAVQLFFVGGDVREAAARVADYGAAVEASGLAHMRLVAPFLRTVVGTDTYTDQLW